MLGTTKNVLHQFFLKQTPKLASRNLAIIKRNNVRKFGFSSPDLVTAADGFMVGGRPRGHRVKNFLKAPTLLLGQKNSSQN